MKEENLSFAALFFRLYDRKVAAGEITFTQIGMNKAVFIRLCQGEEVDMTKEEVEELCKNMKLSDDETKKMLEAACR